MEHRKCSRARTARLAAGLALLLALPLAWAREPNIVLILADDLGRGDVGALGGRRIRTPALDAIAADGVVLTHFYASANICTPSRAGLMTGRYPVRSGLAWDVVGAHDEHGLPPSEVTLAELLGQAGYATALVGKWHLGNRPRFWPTRHGFQRFFGVPHSNDMEDFALYEGERKIEQPVEQSTLTRRYTERAQAFIEENRQRPFFLYLAHTFPHIPLFASPDFQGSSGAGLYGDVVQELDWSTGEIVRTLKSLGLYENTLLLFTSDNGAWWEGSNGDNRGMKGSTWEGAFRVGLVGSWPARIPAGKRSAELAVNTDLFPTIAAAAGVPLPAELQLDGHDLLDMLSSDTDAPSPHEYFYYFQNEDIAAIRDRRWKLVSRAYYRRHLGALDKFEQIPEFTEPYWLLFDLQDEEPERYSVARDHPKVVQRLAREMSRANKALRATATREPQLTYPP